jgi:hypothetical protein
MARFEVLPGFNKQWRDAVIFQPLATNRATIYNRGANSIWRILKRTLSASR